MRTRRNVSVRGILGTMAWAVAGASMTTFGGASALGASLTLPNTQHPNPNLSSHFTLSFPDYGGVADGGRITQTDFVLEIDPALGTARFEHYRQFVEPITMPGGYSTGNLIIEIEHPSSGVFDRESGEFRIDGDEYVIYFEGDLSAFGLTSPFRLPNPSCGTVEFDSATAGATRTDWTGSGVLPGFFPVPFSFTCSVNGAFTLEAATTYIAASNPFGNAVDAGRPHVPQDDTAWEGWAQVELTLNAAPNAPITPESIAVLEVGGDGFAPTVLAVQPVGSNGVLVTLSEPIEPGAWTQLTHAASGTSVCLASLPADVNADRVSNGADIDELAAGLDAFNEILQPWQCDVDRSGSCTPSDLLAAVDVLNGAASFRVWYQAELAASPCGDPVTASCVEN